MKIESKIREFFTEYGKYISGGLFVGVLAYFMMMSQNLNNNLDGIWHLSNFIAGDWEISLGRGLQRYADRARFGIVSDPFNTILTLFLLSIGNTLILKHFSIVEPVYRGLLILLLSVNPVVCNSLSYSYMSVNFGLAYLFSVFAYVSINSIQSRKQFLYMGFVGGLFLGVSMAFYQAYICVTSILITFTILKALCDKKRLKEIFQYAGISLYALLWGGVIYYGITQALLFRANISLSSYGNASNINPVQILTNLPRSLKRCYLDFYTYYSEKKTFSDLEFIDIVLIGMFAVCLIAIVTQFIKLIKYSRAHAALFAAVVFLLPVAACFVLLIAVGNTMTGLMSMSLVVCTALLRIIIPEENKFDLSIKRLHLILLAGFAWFQLSAVINDQVALKEGKSATISLAENIMYQLSSDGYLDGFPPVAFVGRPGNNAHFAQNDAFQMANEYAKFGCWSTNARNNRVSWSGIITNYLGINVNLCGDTEYQELVRMEQIADMPEFPEEGSICIIHDIVVVKVSDVY